MGKKKTKEVHTRVVGELPSKMKIFSDVIIASVLILVPLYIYFSAISFENQQNDYRVILSETFTFSTSTVNKLPSTLEYDLPQNLAVELLVLQLVILTSLIILFIPVSVNKWILKQKNIFVAAIASKFIQRLIFQFVNLRAKLFQDIRPYMFYTEEEVSARKNYTHFRKALWITLVIFAASFQFAGLIYIRTNSFPDILGFNLTLLNASVAFMILTGSFWMVLVLGIDLLERFDIRVLDLGRSKLMNIGKEFAKFSRNGFNFLTLSFVAIAIQDFRAEDWVQVIVFLDVFFLISLWILLTYETNLEEVGNFLRNGLDKRTLSGAERFVINNEKKRFGEKKLKEAEEQMRKSEARLEVARNIGFVKLLFQSIIVTWFVLLLSIILVGLSIMIIGNPSVNQLLIIELLSSFGIMVLVISFQGFISEDDYLRRELLWFPMFMIGNVIASYIYFEYDLEILISSVDTLIVFELLWFVFVVMRIYPNAPGSEFWKSLKNIIFVLVIFLIMVSTVGYQLVILSYFEFI